MPCKSPSPLCAFPPWWHYVGGVSPPCSHFRHLSVQPACWPLPAVGSSCCSVGKNSGLLSERPSHSVVSVVGWGQNPPSSLIPHPTPKLNSKYARHMGV